MKFESFSIKEHRTARPRAMSSEENVRPSPVRYRDPPDYSVMGDESEPRKPERRVRPRPPGSSPTTAGRARLRNDTARFYPSLRPGGWYALLDRNPEAIDPHARPGYMWIEVDGRPRHVWSAHFEIGSG